MGGEKRSSKGGPGGFRSKWKKLFSGKSTSAVERNQDVLDEERLEFESHMMEDEKRSECSCVSSLSIDDEGAGVKAPNVVARLMGLESLPSADLAESNSIPFYASKPTRGPKKSLQFGPQYLSFHSGRQPTTSMETLSGKMMESSPQKLQKMAKIERFQTETLPMKPVKSYLEIQHKLLSPIKSSGFVSAKSAAHLMETAVKILEPRLHPPAKNKSLIIGSSSISLNDRGQMEDRVSSYRICKPIEIPKKLSEPNAVKCLKGQAMMKSWNGSEDGPSSRVSSERKLLKDLSTSLGQSTVESNQKLPFSSVKKERQVVLPQDCPNTADNKPAGARGQGKSVSLAIQAKVNVQRRENCSSSGHPNSSTIASLFVQDEQGESALNRQRKNQLNVQKNKQKQATSGATNVLRQNNQKQNRLPKPGDQVARKDVVGNISSRQKVANPEGVRNCTISGRTNSCNQMRKVGSFRASEKSLNRRDVEKGSCQKGTNDYPRKKRLIEGSFSSDKNGLVESTFVNGDKTNQEADLTTNSFLNQIDFKRQSLQTVEQAVSSSSKGTDVVSFTFTSPLAAISRCRPSDQALDKQDKKKSCFRDSYGGKNDSGTKSSMSLEGDALSALLERKLKELTSGIQNADGLKTANSGSANTLSILQDFLSTLNSGGPILKEHDAESSSVTEESNLNHVHIARADRSSSTSQTVNKDLRLQATEMEERQHIGTQKEHLLKVDPAEEKEHFSPVSILEAAYSNDSCNSLDSSDAIYGGPLDHSCQASKNPLIRADKELLDSACSLFTAAREKPGFLGVQLQRSDACSNEQELEYVRDIISNTRLIFEEIAVGMPNEIVDPILFNNLESNCSTSGSAEDQKQMKIERRLWFDCVTECVNSKYGQYSKGDCRNWTRGHAVIGRTGLSEDIFKEMLGWRSMGELKVDEILSKDMSTGPGRWIDFQNEEFEVGMEIEEDIFDSLVEEVVLYTFGLEI